jgi:hypothetical protein
MYSPAQYRHCFLLYHKVTFCISKLKKYIRIELLQTYATLLLQFCTYLAEIHVFY